MPAAKPLNNGKEPAKPEPPRKNDPPPAATVPAANNNKPINNGKGPAKVEPPQKNGDNRGKSPPRNRSPNRGRGRSPPRRGHSPRGYRSRSNSPQGPIIVNVNVVPNQPSSQPQQININQNNIIQQPAAPPSQPQPYPYGNNNTNNNNVVSPPQVRPAILPGNPTPAANQVLPCKHKIINFSNYFLKTFIFFQCQT